jgi:WD40 repeat protein
MHVFSRAVGLCAVMLGVGVVQAQTRQVTLDDAKAIEKKFETERAAAQKNFPPQSLELADQLAKRGQSALGAKTYRDAARLFREARWQIPYLPPDLPDGIVRVFGNTRMRHGDVVNQVAYSPDGTKLASASKDGTVKVWDLGNGQEIRTFRASNANHRSVAWSRDGKLIAAAGGKEIYLWNADTGALTHTLKGHQGEVFSVAFRDDDKALVSGGDDGAIRIWDVEKGAELQVVNGPIGNKRPSLIWQVVYSPNGKLIASVNAEGVLQVWNPTLAPPQQKLVLGVMSHPTGAYQVAFSPDMTAIYTCGGGSDRAARQFGGTGPEGQNIAGSGARQKVFDVSGGGHTEAVTALTLSPDGKTLVTGSRDHSIRVWDVNTAKVIRTLQGHTDEITSLTFSRDGSQLASASKDQNIRIWNLSSTDEHRNFAGHDGYVWSAVFSNDGKLIASAGADRTIIIRDATTGAILKKFPAHSLAVTALAFNDNGSQLVSVGGDQLVKLWNVNTGTLIKEFRGHTSAIMAVAFSHDGKRILSGGADKAARLWDIAAGAVVQTFPNVRSPISSVALRKDGKEALIGCADGMVHVFDLTEAPKEKGSVPAHLSGVGALAYSPDGSRMATCGGDKLVRIWKLPDSGAPAPLFDLKGHSNAVSSVAFSNDGRLLVSGGGDLIIKVWDLQSATELRSLRGHSDWVSSVCFGADSRFILTASVDKTAKVWELSNEETAPPVGHTRRLNTLAVSPNGKWLASGGEDHTIKIWDMASGQEQYTLTEHTDNVRAVAFDSSGERLVSGGDDRKLRIWDLKTQRVLKTLDCDGTVGVIVFNTKGDKFLVWYYRPGIGSQTATTVQVYDRDGVALDTFTEREKQISCLSFTPSGNMVALGSTDGTVRIRDLANKGERVGGDMPVHQKGMGDLVFTPDGKKLITGDEDGEIKIWDLAKREAIKTISAHKGRLFGIAMSPDGKRFVSVGPNDVRLWNVETGAQIKEWELTTPVSNMVFTADSKHLVTANSNTTLYLFELPK